MYTLVASVIVSLVLVTTVSAREPFVFDATVDNVSRILGFDDVDDVIDTLKNAQLERIFQNYTDQSPVNINLDLRGLPVRLQYGQGDTTLNFAVPSCRINRSFTGATRDESSQQFEDYLKREGSNDLTCILQSLAKNSPIDPLTGIAGSLYQTMTLANYLLGTNHSYLGTDADTPNQFGFGIRFGRYSAEGFDSTVITIPLTYTINTVNGLGFAFDLPITLADSEGAKAYNASLGFGVRLPVSRWLRFDRDEWDITPLARIGAAGSPDMVSAGLVYAFGGLSHYVLHLTPDFQVDMINLVSRYATVPLRTRDLHIDYALENFVFRNGLSATLFLPSRIPFWPFSSKKLSIKAAFTDTRFTGDELFANSYEEVALDFGTVAQKGGTSWDQLRVGFQYTFSDVYNGFSFNLGYTF